MASGLYLSGIAAIQQMDFPMQHVIEQLEVVALEIGKSGFERSVFAAFRKALSTSYVACMVIAKHGRAQMPLLCAENTELHAAIEADFMEFLAKGLPRDKSFQLYKRRKGRQLEEYTFDDPSAQDRFTLLHRKFGLTYSLSALTRAGGDICYFTLGFRSVPSARTALGEWVPFLELYAKIVHRHAEIMAEQSATAHKTDLQQGANIKDAASALLSLEKGLTGRQAEILAMTALGHSAESIGLILGLSPHTVSTHKRRAFERIGVKGTRGLFQVLHDLQ